MRYRLLLIACYLAPVLVGIGLYRMHFGDGGGHLTVIFGALAGVFGLIALRTRA